MTKTVLEMRAKTDKLWESQATHMTELTALSDMLWPVLSDTNKQNSDRIQLSISVQEARMMSTCLEACLTEMRVRRMEEIQRKNL